MSGSLTVSGNKYIGFSGDSWDGSFLPPQLATGSKVALVGETGLQNSTPLLTVEAGSITADLIPATGTFTLSIKVATGTIGQTLAVYRSNYNGGDVWTVNSPDTTCTLDSGNMCTFRADHLSLFTMGIPAPSIISSIVSFLGGGGASPLVKDDCKYDINKTKNLTGANIE